jgi:hypothetical protein
MISILTGAFDEGAPTAVTPRREGRGTLTSDELLMFLCILVVAGNETRGMHHRRAAPQRLPRPEAKLIDQRADHLAVDEMSATWRQSSRSAAPSPDHEFHGEAAQDRRQGAHPLPVGQPRRAWFEDPDLFRIDRDPNPSADVSPHFCLGANLAKLEVKVVFEELFRDCTTLASRRRRSPAATTLVLAIEHLPAVFTPTGSRLVRS